MSNNTYVLEITYYYDLNDGNGTQQIKTSREITTQPLETPKLDITTTVSDSEIILNQLITDNDNIIKINQPIVINQTQPIITKTSENSYKITNITSNQNYTIEITYQYDLNDGNGIKEVNKQINVTTSKQTPTISLKMTNITSNASKLNITTTDINQTGSIKEIGLYKGETLIKNIDLVDYNITELESNTTYIIKVSYEYDLNDGTGSKTLTEEETFKTLKETPTVNIKLEPEKTSIKVKPEITDTDNAGRIKKVELYLNNEIKATKTENYEFTDLLSNTSYVVKLYYEYDVNNGTDELIITSTIQTTKKDQPVVDVELVSEKTSINYQVVYTDTENTCQINKIKLTKGNVEIKNLSTTSGKFENLLSNTTYEVIVEYSYDSNEGNGLTTSTISKTIKTLSLSKPIVGIMTSSLTDSLIEGNVSLVDVDNLFNLIDIKLYQGDNLLETLTSTLEFSFNVNSNTDYKVVVSYSYDLQDGRGLQTENYEYNLRSIKQIPTIIFTPYFVSQNKIEYNLLISDNNVTGRINLIALYEGKTFIKKLNENIISIEELKSNTDYTLKINYVYDFDDGYGSRELNKEFNFKTLKIDPTYETETYNVSKYGFNINYNVNDPDNALTFIQTEILLNNKVIKTVTSLNELNFNELLSNTRYQIITKYEKDLNNGTEEVTSQKYITTVALEKPTVEITLNTTKNSLTYDYQLTDLDNISTIESIKLYYKNQLITTSLDKLYEGLYSNSEYKLIISLLNDYNDGREKQLETYEKIVKTKALEDIDFTINLTPGKKDITYSYQNIDNDNISTIKEIRLYLGNILIKTTTNLSENIFTNLYSNTLYKVVYIIEKDFNDDKDIVTSKYEQTIKTTSLMIPIVNMKFTSTVEDITYRIISVDNDLILNLIKLDVYDGETLIATITDFTNNVIDNLESNTLYTFKLSYKYNLNENSEDITNEISEVYSTLSYNVRIESMDILNETQPKTNEDINIKFNLDNRSNIKVNYLIINNQKYNVLGGNGITNVIVLIRSPKMSGNLELNVERMGYTINGVIVEQVVEGNVNLNIEILSRLDIIDISIVNGSNFDKNDYKLGYVLTIDNPNGYTIDSVLYSDYSNAYEKSYRIDDNHFFIKKAGGSVKAIKYIDNEGNQAIRQYTGLLEMNFTTKAVDSETHSLIIRQVSTPEDLMNMNENAIYELVNDIDMTGYNWKPYYFIGYFDGKGHTISNLTYIHEDEWQSGAGNNNYYYMQNILYLRYSSEFKNVFFKDIHIDVDSTSLPSYTTNIVGSDGGCKLENVLYSGYINFKNNGVECGNYQKCVDSTYIVDHLIVNGTNYIGDEVISTETFNSTEFKENTLEWNFKQKELKEYNGIKYQIISNSYIMISSYTGTEPNLIIPNQINGLPVVGIDDLAFENNTTITSIEIPATVLTIGSSILSGCYNLESLIVNNTIAVNDSSCILRGIFGTRYYDNSTSHDTGYSYRLPNSIKNVTLNSTDKEYRKIDFSNNAYIENVILPENITSIGERAFYNCSSLTSITIPNSVTSIGSYAFEGCLSLTNVYYSGTIEDWCNITFSDYYSNPMSRAQHFYMLDENKEYKEVTEIEIPNTIIEITDYSFRNFTALTSITIPNSVTSIGYEVFYNCSSLTSITIPNSVTSIGGSAFSYCSSLTSIEIPNSVTSIGGSAFSYCSSLTSITIPNSVTSIGSYAFDYCSSLTNVYYSGTIEDWCNITFSNSSSNPMSYAQHFYMLDENKEYKEVTEIEISNTITKIGNYQFCGFYNLTSITIPNSVTSIGKYAFSNCDSLTNVYYSGTIEDWCNITFSYFSSNPMDYAQHFYMLDENKEYKEVTEIEIPNTITKIGDYQFFGFNNVTSITIPNSVTSIGEYAFRYCSSLTIYCEASSKPSGWDANWNGATKIIWNYVDLVEKDDIKYLVLKDHVEVVEINTTNAVIEEKIVIDGIDYQITKIQSQRDNKILETISIPSGVKELDDSLFYGCDNLTTVIFAENSELTTIGYSTFGNCTKLTNIILPSKLTSIDEWAFNCCKFSSIIIPETVIEIGKNAFANNGSLTIYCEITSKPDGWAEKWYGIADVVWGYTE